MRASGVNAAIMANRREAHRRENSRGGKCR